MWQRIKAHFYVKALRTEFPTRARDDVFFNKKGINHLTKKMGNQIIERYHSTFRERDKVIRGFKIRKDHRELSCELEDVL